MADTLPKTITHEELLVNFKDLVSAFETGLVEFAGYEFRNLPDGETKMLSIRYKVLVQGSG